jgi:hypothetical protein
MGDEEDRLAVAIGEDADEEDAPPRGWLLPCITAAGEELLRSAHGSRSQEEEEEELIGL